MFAPLAQTVKTVYTTMNENKHQLALPKTYC